MTVHPNGANGGAVEERVRADLKMTGGKMPVDIVAAVFDEAPAHPNAWGAVWARAIRDGVIRRGSLVRESRAPRKHRHCYPVYVSCRFLDTPAAPTDQVRGLKAHE